MFFSSLCSQQQVRSYASFLPDTSLFCTRLSGSTRRGGSAPKSQTPCRTLVPCARDTETTKYPHPGTAGTPPALPTPVRGTANTNRHHSHAPEGYLATRNPWRLEAMGGQIFYWSQNDSGRGMVRRYNPGATSFPRYVVSVDSAIWTVGRYIMGNFAPKKSDCRPTGTSFYLLPGDSCYTLAATYPYPFNLEGIIGYRFRGSTCVQRDTAYLTTPHQLSGPTDTSHGHTGRMAMHRAVLRLSKTTRRHTTSAAMAGRGTAQG